jgi:hypothetical protein
MNVRSAKPSDIPHLLALEDKCWVQNLRQSSETITRLVTSFPDNQYVLESDGEICGVLYTQTIADIQDIRGSYRELYDSNDPNGSTIQLISINCDTQKCPNGAVLLRNRVVEAAKSNPIITSIVAITRCSRLMKYWTPEELRNDKLRQHVKSYKEDPMSFFHIQGVASDLTLSDDENFGPSVLIQYPSHADLSQFSGVNVASEDSAADSGVDVAAVDNAATSAADSTADSGVDVATAADSTADSAADSAADSGADVAAVDSATGSAADIATTAITSHHIDSIRLDSTRLDSIRFDSIRLLDWIRLH